MGGRYSISHTELVNQSSLDAELQFYKGCWVPILSVYSGLYTSTPVTQFDIRQANQVWAMTELASAKPLGNSNVQPEDIQFFTSADQTVRIELNKSNPALWRLKLLPTRIRIKLVNKSNKNVTILGTNSLTVIPNSCTTANTFTDIATDLGTELKIREYKPYERWLTSRQVEDELLFDCKDKDGCVYVTVTNRVVYRSGLIEALSV